MAKILFFEDDPLIADMYRKVFELKNIEFFHQENGEDCLDVVKEISPDLIVSDVMMPHKTGLEVLAEIKGDPATEKINVIILSNLADPETKKTATERGACHYLVKMENDPMAAADIMLGYLPK